MSIKNALKNPIRECVLGAKRLGADNPVLCSMRSKIRCMYEGAQTKNMRGCPTAKYILGYEGPNLPMMKWTKNVYK